jgi:hypothetical protein
MTKEEKAMVQSAVDAVHAAIDRGESSFNVATPPKWTRGNLAFEMAVVERLDMLGRIKPEGRRQPC